MEWIQQWVERFHAWQRGEKRVAPPEQRGRVYERVRDGGAPGAVAAKVRLKPSMTTRVFRAEEKAWYRIDPKTRKLEKE